MIKKILVVIGLIASLSVVAGCTSWMQPGRVETDWGTAYKLSIFNQTLDPEAEKNVEPVIGLGGAEANLNMERYRKGFEKEITRPTYILNVGGVGTTQ